MTIRRVWSGASGAANGTTWTDAYTTFAAAVTASTTDGDVILVHYTHQETIGAATTWTFANNVTVYSVDKDSSDAYTVMGTGGWIGTSGTVYACILNGAYKVGLYGITIRSGGTGNASITLNGSNNGHFEYTDCYIWVASGSSSDIILGSNGEQCGYTKLVNCTLRVGNAGSELMFGDVRTEFIGGGMSASGVSQTNMCNAGEQGPPHIFEGFDASINTGNLVANISGGAHTFYFVNCKLGTGVVPLAAQTTCPNKGSGEVFLFNCAAGDQHYHIAHYNALGETTVSTSIYANDNPTYDGTNKCSWKIVSSANASLNTPYQSPWIDKYHSATASITPYLEILRDGSATAYDNDEVWGEFSIQANSGFPLSTIKSDVMTPYGTPAAQTTSSKGASDWTGENATAWFGKLEAPSATTPAEIGHLRARVCVGLASATVYVDPQIRGT